MDIDRKYVLDRLAKKKALDPDCVGFGVQRHKYKLQPVISERKLDKMERKYDFTLPDDYRNFVLEIGNGGAGPSYGLYSVEASVTGQTDRTYQYRSDDVRKTISKSFIRPDERFKCREDFYDDYGMLMLCQHGCANDDYLVINGSERGFVWCYLEWVGHQTPSLKNQPKLITSNMSEDQQRATGDEWVSRLLAARDSEKCKFTDWYVKWLEEPPYILPGTQKRRVSRTPKKWFGF